MSFRKRNIIVHSPSSAANSDFRQSFAPGTRPSPLNGRLTTSTGTASLDHILAGHVGIPIGTSLLIEESGTTDYGGVLLRYFAAEGLVQGHHVHVLGVGHSWRRELPGLAETKDQPSPPNNISGKGKLKIAWRYETLASQSLTPEVQSAAKSTDQLDPFCHSFDVSKKLEAGCTKGHLEMYPFVQQPSHQTSSSLAQLIEDLRAKVKVSTSSVHRVVVPSLLSPTTYPPTSCKPEMILRFLHGLRSILRQFPNQVTALVSLPISLHPRSSGLSKWMEVLFDGVIELVHLHRPPHISGTSDERGVDKVQGLVRVHTLPVFHERGGGLQGTWDREDMSFYLSASSGLVIKPFSLPPVGTENTEPVTVNSKTEKLEF